MVGKLFVVALFCVAFAQGQEDLSNSIKSALFRLKGLRESTERRVDGAISGVEYKKKAIDSKTDGIIDQQKRMEQQSLRTLERLALDLEAKVEDRPAALECIQKAKSVAVENIQSLGPKFEEDMQRLRRTKLANIETASAPFATIKKGIQTKYQQAETEILNAKTTTTVRQVLTRATREFDTLYADARRAVNNISVMYTNFQRDSNTFFQNVRRQISGMQGLGIRRMRECVTRRDFLEQL